MSTPTTRRILFVCLLLASPIAAGCGDSDNDSPTGPSGGAGPLWTRAGTGNDVFAKPSFVRTVRVTGNYGALISNFIVWCDNQLVVNELLGTSRSTQYTGTHATPNCSQIRIENSNGVNWTITEVR